MPPPPPPARRRQPRSKPPLPPHLRPPRKREPWKTALVEEVVRAPEWVPLLDSDEIDSNYRVDSLRAWAWGVFKDPAFRKVALMAIQIEIADYVAPLALCSTDDFAKIWRSAMARLGYVVEADDWR